MSTPPALLSDAALAEALRAIVGDPHVVTDPALLAGRVVDWTGRWQGACALAVAPGSSAEAAAVLAACAGRHLVVQGGNTGLVGGAVPDAGDVLFLTHRLTAMKPPDLLAHTVVVEAGATLAAVQAHLAPYGLELGVDIAARDSATIGGMAATNAGGQRVLRDGAMRRHVLSVEAYDVSGQQLAALHDLIKDNTGYDLASLLVGSEGTLGVITKLLLRVIPRLSVGAVVVVGLPDLDAVGAFVGNLRRRRDDLRAAELASAASLGLVGETLERPVPVSTPWAVLLQFAAKDLDLEMVASSVSEALAAAGVPDSPVLAAADPAGIRTLWNWRDRITEAIAERAVELGHPVVKLDVSLPAAALTAFVVDVRERFEGDSAYETYLFGHVADGNVHVNVIGPHAYAVEDWVLRRVARAGGSISAEHGIGRAKAPWFELARTPAEREAMRAVKRALDPGGRLGRSLWTADR